MRLTFDCETCIKNNGHPFTPENFVVSYSVKEDDKPVVFKHYMQPDFISYLQECFDRATLVIGFNLKFDILWCLRNGIKLPTRLRVFDCQFAEFVVTGQMEAFPSLNGCLEKYGLELKSDEVAKYWGIGIDTPDIPPEILEEYGNRDVAQTYELYRTYMSFLSEKQHKLILLMGLDMLALATAEFNGMKYNREGANQAIAEYKKSLEEIDNSLWEYVPYECRKWFNWNSGDDLSALLYGGVISYDYFTSEEAVYKSGQKKGEPYTKNTWHTYDQTFVQRFKPLEGTEVAKCIKEGYTGTMFYKVDDPTLQQLKSRRKEDKELLALLARRAKVAKVVEMLEQFETKFVTLGWQDNYVHGQFNQVVARTGRLSSSNPNLQNTPEEVDRFLVSRYD